MYETMLRQLCGSEQRYRVLRALFENPGKSYHLRGLATAAGVDASNVAKLLPKLTAAGLVQREAGEPSARYRARRDNPLFKALTSLFSQASNLVAELRDVAQSLDADVAVFGSSASGTDTPESDLDVLVVGPTSQISAQAAFKPVARRHKRAINVTVIDRKSLKKELAAGSQFWTSVLSGPTVPLKGALPHVANA